MIVQGNVQQTNGIERSHFNAQKRFYSDDDDDDFILRMRGDATVNCNA